MKKMFSVYTIVWAICYVLFNAITFAVPADISGVYKDEASFWIGYLFITVAFVGQLLAGYIAFKQATLQKTFYNVPLLRISFIGLIVMFLAGTVSMVIKPWIGALLCFIVLAFTAIALIGAKGAAVAVDDIDEKIKVKTYYIKALTVDVERSMMRASSPEMKAECKKVYEAVRYSDPMSHEALADIEKQISFAYNALLNAVMANNIEQVRVAANDMIILIGDRNSKCKILK